MTDFAPVRAGIVATLSGVQEIGRVQEFERGIQADNAIRQHYGWPENSTGKADVRGWFPRIREFSGVQDRIGRGRRITTIWEIVGFVGFQDAEATDLIVQELLGRICAAFDADPRLGGSVIRCAAGDGPNAPAGIQCESIVPVRLGTSTLCHRVILSLPTQHFAQ